MKQTVTKDMTYRKVCAKTVLKSLAGSKKPSELPARLLEEPNFLKMTDSDESWTFLYNTEIKRQGL
jgi:hypothetical protein